MPIGKARARLADLVNRAVNDGQVTYLMRHGRRVAIVAPVEFAAAGAHPSTDLEPTPPDPDEYLPEARQVAALIPDNGERTATLATLAALQQLPQRQRAVATLHFLGGCPLPEVAELLQISAATARVHLFHARRTLAEAVGEPVWPVRLVLQEDVPAAERDAHPASAQPVVSEWSAGWTAQAACRTTEADSLFVQGAAQNRAKLVCMGCPVRAECLADALDNRVEFGVWGGMTERERRALLRRRRDVPSWRALLEAGRQAAAADTDPVQAR
jgi:WhiB family transcriptional regulator, redox-sensing transcriptional regulator